MAGEEESEREREGVKKREKCGRKASRWEGEGKGVRERETEREARGR